ncbi:MAG: transposase [Anaerolineae bacterium]|nr:transposase [Anaerolineae bacterium]
MPERTVKLCPGEYYHLYNRGHNRERIFYERENFLFFLRRMRKHLTPILDVVAYCLMYTHYHLLVRVKAQTSEVSKTSEVSTAVSNAMMRFSVSYTKAINKRYDRVGALFQGAFQAKHVDGDKYLVHLSRYIHLNPVLSGLVEQPEEWEFSSYQDYVGLRDGTLPKSEIVLSQFPSPESYREFVEPHMEREWAAIAGLLFDE